MTDYAITNIKELDDSAKQFGLSPDIEARFGRKALDAQKGGFSYQRLAADFRQPFGHRHEEQEEIYVVVSGSGKVKLGDEIVDVTQWDAIRVAPQTKRAFEAGSEGLELLVFGAGPTGDAETIDDFWPRDGDRG
jgi:mannose-6-phosphate isomerase-like protein (cupin superfamily)